MRSLPRIYVVMVCVLATWTVGIAGGALAYVGVCWLERHMH
ncbi:hypothetical protein HOS23_gp61 [Rhizobium phage RHEph09]|uniref:Uncharacterized protein n=1 Tax=Rhizobium phage RHEph09 TaxID=1220716 RepID=L7TNX7_9CAUD|nr:hypothetical protein HOS23_gp61 [Rhizobium phage RHEph09]AGC36044.1 hypothetical protein RHEph09_gp061 [Rhizobium phage RHEph09]